MRLGRKGVLFTVMAIVVVASSTTAETFLATVSPFVTSIWKISTSESAVVRTGHV